MPTTTSPVLALARATALVAALGSMLPAQAGLVDVFWGPAWLEAQAQASFQHLGTDTVTRVIDAPPVQAVLPSVSPGFPLGGVHDLAAAASALASDHLGGSDGPKDQASGQVQVRYTVGTGGVADTFQIDFSGVVSNEDSWLGPGLPAELATVHLEAAIVLEISQNSGDRTGFWFGDRVGSLALPALRAANEHESFSLAVRALYPPGRPVLLVQEAGGPGTSLDLYFGERYELRLQYSMEVPFGIDPPISLQVGGSVSAVPEPGPAGLWALGLLCIGLLGPAVRTRQVRA